MTNQHSRSEELRAAKRERHVHLSQYPTDLDRSETLCGAMDRFVDEVENATCPRCLFMADEARIANATEDEMRTVLGDDMFNRLAMAGRRSVNWALSAHDAGAGSVSEYRKMVKG